MKRLLLPCLAALAAAAPGRAGDAKPNIVILLADDLGAYDVGWRGSEIRTPNLDRLAAAGAKLEQFYVQPLCSPTRAALLTGRYPFRYGLQVGVIRPHAPYGLSLRERTLPQALKDAGYETAITGKWHLGESRPEYLPTRRGFDHQYGLYFGEIDYFTHLRDGTLDWHRDDKESKDEGYSTHLIAQEAVRRIKERDKTKPLFLYVPFNGVHLPLETPPEYAAPYGQLPPKRRTYAGMLAAVDEAAGQIVKEIEAEGLSKNTVIFFSSDNGGYSPGKITSNGPLRAGKGTIYEGGVHTCASVTWPGRIPAGSSVQAPLHIVDWYSTILALAGANPSQSLPPDGRDIRTALGGKPGPVHDEIIINSAPRVGAIRAGDWKLIVRQSAGNAPADAAGPYPPPAPVELYDLARDSGEKSNVAAAHPDIVRDLRARYEKYAAQAVPPLAAGVQQDDHD